MRKSNSGWTARKKRKTLKKSHKVGEHSAEELSAEEKLKKNIVDSIQGRGRYKARFIGKEGDRTKRWEVTIDGSPVQVIYDKTCHKVVSFISE